MNRIFQTHRPGTKHKVHSINTCERLSFYTTFVFSTSIRNILENLGLARLYYIILRMNICMRTATLRYCVIWKCSSRATCLDCSDDDNVENEATGIC